MPTMNIKTENARNTNLRRLGYAAVYSTIGVGAIFAAHTLYTAINDKYDKGEIRKDIKSMVEKGEYLAAQERLDGPEARTILDEQEIAKSKKNILEIREAAERKSIRDMLRPQIIHAYASGEELPPQAATAFAPADLEDLRRESVTHTPEGLLARIHAGVGIQRLEAIAELRLAYPTHPEVESLDTIEFESHIDIGRGYFRTNAIEFDDILKHVQNFQRFLAIRQDPTDINAIGEYLNDGNEYIKRMSACARIDIGDEVVLTVALGDASGKSGRYFRGDSLKEYPLGTVGKVVRADRSDNTVRVRTPSGQENWFLESEVRAKDDLRCDGRGQFLVGEKVKTIAALGSVKETSGYFHSQSSIEKHPLGSEGYITVVGSEGNFGVKFSDEQSYLLFAPKELERTQTDFLPIIQQHLLSIEREARR